MGSRSELLLLLLLFSLQSNEFLDGVAGTVERSVDKLGMVSYKPGDGAQPIARLRQYLESDIRRLPKVCVVVSHDTIDRSCKNCSLCFRLYRLMPVL